MKTTPKTLWLLTTGCIVFAQPAAAPLSFDVASVKPSTETRGMFSRFLPGGGLRASGATLKNRIALAYGVREFLIAGAPTWADTERFDIDARMDTAPVDESRNTGKRLRTLLADRFQLTFHRETKEQPIYALIVAKAGPKFQESTEARIRMGRGLITGHGVGLRLLALNLSNLLSRRVIDKTGLTGKYDFDLKWTPDSTEPDVGQFGPPPDPNGPSIFTALPEQLGLRLESEKAPVEILVIDRAEKPSEN